MSQRGNRNEQQDAMLRREFQQEAARIEQGAQAVALEENLLDKSNLLVRILEQAHEDTGTSKRYKRMRYYHTFAKSVAVIAIVLFGIFGMAMTSQANRTNLMNSVEHFFSGASVTVLDTGENHKQIDTSEKEARMAIQDALGCPVPVFLYWPYETRFLNCDIDKAMGVAFMEYQCDEKRITFLTYNKQADASRYEVVDSKIVSQEETGHNKILVTVYEEQSNQGVEYRSQWEYENNYYELRGNLPLEEIYAILDKIRY